MITLRLAQESDAAEIHTMQIRAFMPLYDKYRDDATSPAKESVERVRARIIDPMRRYFFIECENQPVGAICVKQADGECVVSPIFVLPEYQGCGIAQQAMKLAEAEFPQAKRWKLDTILQEAGNCHLYEKMGYVRTGGQRQVNENMTLIDYVKPMQR